MSYSENRHNLKMWQGATFGMTITVKYANNAVQNLTGYSARMQMRLSHDNPTAAESLTSSNGEIVIVPAEGNLILELAATRTANIHVDLSNEYPPKTSYVYDLELQDTNSKVSKLLYGIVDVYGEVTR